MNPAPASHADRFAAPAEREVWRILADVPDPEIPVLSVVELGSFAMFASRILVE